MLITFQILLYVVIAFMVIGVLGEQKETHRQQYTAVLIATIISLASTFWIG